MSRKISSFFASLRACSNSSRNAANSSTHKIIFIALLFGLVSISYALEYLWLTDNEQTSFGDLGSAFVNGDTLNGIVSSNSGLDCRGHVVFLDIVTCPTCDSSLIGCDWEFLGPPPSPFDYLIYIPHRLNRLRELAFCCGNFIDYGNQEQLKLKFSEQGVRAYRWTRGAPFDSSQFILIENVPSWTQYIFINAPVRVEGLVQGQWVIGSSYDIKIDNDIRYIDSDPLTGITPEDSPNFLALAAEGDIKVRNTTANGRENSGRPCGQSGYLQTNPDSTDVVITAALYALGSSFTFEKQSDPDSGYVYDCSPDERGDINLFGGLVQQRRGYYHRSNLSSTGYRLHLKYDQRLRCWYDGVMDTEEHVETTYSIDFGNVPVNQTALDTAYLFTGNPVNLGAVSTVAPFGATRITQPHGTDFFIPMSFHPTQARLYHGFLNITTTCQTYQFVLLGRGVTGAEPPPISMDIFPNPFNLTTTISYEVFGPADVELILYNVLGQTAKHEKLHLETAGIHTQTLDATNLASGIYFAHLKIGTQTAIKKVMLMK